MFFLLYINENVAYLCMFNKIVITQDNTSVFLIKLVKIQDSQSLSCDQYFSVEICCLEIGVLSICKEWV